MARAIGVGLVAIVLIAVGVLVARDQTENSHPPPSIATSTSMPRSGQAAGIEDERPVPRPGNVLDSRAVSTERSNKDIDRAAEALAAARARYAAAQSAVAEARASIAESERGLEDLERFVEELEARGEDPAEHAEEGMKRFNPAFDAYERASAELDRAEAEVEIERVKMFGAEQEWKAARHRAGSE